MAGSGVPATNRMLNTMLPEPASSHVGWRITSMATTKHDEDGAKGHAQVAHAVAPAASRSAQ